jgi:hypothetical protein
VMDFGLARMIGTEHLTNDGYMVGTPAYMSPEQVLGRDIDGRADLYAMGVVLFRLLTSQLPFKADSGVAMVQRQLHDPPTPVRHVRSELPVACEEVLARALEKVAANRYQTADEFRSALTRLDPSLASTSASRVPSSVAPPPSAVTAADGAGVHADTLVLPRDGGAKLVKAALRARASRAGLAPTAVAAGVVLLAGIPVTGVLMWRARQAAAESSAAPMTPSSAAPSTASTPAALLPEPSRTKAAEKSASGAPAPKKAPKPAAVVPASDASRAALPVAIFSRIRLLILGEHEPRDRDATLRLAADGFEVLDGTRALEGASWQDVIGLYHSHSKEPWWTNADGQSAPIARPGGRGFGFLKGTPNWITLRTRRNFVPLRVREGDVARLITELETRAGVWVVTAK